MHLTEASSRSSLFPSHSISNNSDIVQNPTDQVFKKSIDSLNKSQTFTRVNNQFQEKQSATSPHQWEAITISFSTPDKAQTYMERNAEQLQGTLSLTLTEMDFFPKSIEKCKNLKKLELALVNLRSLSGIETLENLEELRVSDCSLEWFQDLGKLSQIKILDIEGNSDLFFKKRLEKSEIPSTALPDLTGLTRLKELRINYCFLTNLPSSMWKLTQLIKLDLSCNNLSSLPEEIKNLESLEELRLDHNAFSSLPSGIGDLPNLESLSVNDNSLTSFPSLKNCRQLSRLDISHNQLKVFPEGIEQCIQLRVLSIDNPLYKCIPSHIKERKNLEITCFSSPPLSRSRKIRNFINSLFHH